LKRPAADRQVAIIGFAFILACGKDVDPKHILQDGLARMERGETAERAGK